ncbi:uncharacterized protein CC84DRAFT_1204022 [Paraphaeosphaeria sporulosa]|uniref:Glycoside hydrolase 131 catalytic N-terminal domain-containing protein n=1 Tax=Paraphaeosphaeria sporulosa TaxID=1460663 RepID=A0A177CMF7_9PLEO|nr:uncharacterized protein CC84DRAFT_1204022 [Paraphaeosphaeria sporulosa]OAG08734.1 hypothetical protein CC84DRAFT_1204022 [Paraphaeosphaeria sporulosa]
MVAKSILLLAVAAIARARAVTQQDCNSTAVDKTAATIVYDGRVKENATKADFDTTTGPFGKDFVKGQNLTFSQLVAFPSVEPSNFDAQVGAKAIEVQINDQSIFVPGNNIANAQTAVRRTELNPNGGGNTTTGVKTLHVSLQPSAQHPLNISHEYSLVFLERADFGANLFMLRTGTLLGSNGGTKNDLVLQGNTAAGTKTLFTTPFTEGVWTNLALQLDFTANTIQVFQSSGSAPLVQATEPLPNDLTGNGQFHFGVNKNPTDPGTDVLRSGFQESGILEGVVYGGIFVEDTASSSVTLA